MMSWRWFQGMFYELANQNVSLENTAVAPMIQENDRMVYLALSEFFFDSGMFSYYKAGIFQMHIAHDRVRKPVIVFTPGRLRPNPISTPSPYPFPLF